MARESCGMSSRGATTQHQARYSAQSVAQRLPHVYVPDMTCKPRRALNQTARVLDQAVTFRLAWCEAVTGSESSRDRVCIYVGFSPTRTNCYTPDYQVVSPCGVQLCCWSICGLLNMLLCMSMRPWSRSLPPDT